jgi:hypothetical protein
MEKFLGCLDMKLSLKIISLIFNLIVKEENGHSPIAEKTSIEMSLLVSVILLYNDAVFILWLGFHSSWTPSHYETGSVIFVKMP